jgi:hypothetical protein
MSSLTTYQIRTDRKIQTEFGVFLEKLAAQCHGSVSHVLNNYCNDNTYFFPITNLLNLMSFIIYFRITSFNYLSTDTWFKGDENHRNCTLRLIYSL